MENRMMNPQTWLGVTSQKWGLKRLKCWKIPWNLTLTMSIKECDVTE
jgi:hypothetical protein